MPRFHPVTSLRERELFADALLATFITAMSVAFHFLGFDQADVSRDPTWWTVPIVVGATLPIAWRRRWPIATALVVVAFQVASEVADLQGSGFVGVAIGLYTLGAHTTGARRTNAGAVITVALGSLFVAGLIVDELDLGGFISSIFVLSTAYVLGDNVRRRRERADSLVERAERAEREQQLLAQRQVTAERTRIARELHDVVAHSVSVMVIQAAAARRSLDSSPANAHAALLAIEDTGRQTMNELRGILGVLRDDADHSSPDASDAARRTPQPTLADLDALVAACSDLPITLTRRGPLDDLAHSVTLAGFRVLQESLTNVRRHAGPVECVDVSVSCDDDVLDVVVADDGRGAAADHDGEPGYGLVGMRERVAAVGGTLRAEPRVGGGWRVQARLPLDPQRSLAGNSSTGPAR